jgi:mannose-6-phosphate isomerase-like protein (cupin superfamily)
MESRLFGGRLSEASLEFHPRGGARKARPQTPQVPQRRIPMGDVGTTKIFEDDRIILWEFVVEPGERTPNHTHHHDYLFYVLEGSTMEVFDAEGNPRGSFEARTGDVFSLKLDGDQLVSDDDKGLRVSATHSTRNLGSSRYREILVEKKA